MALLTPALLSLRRDPRILKLPPYLSLACILIGIAWLLLLPLNEYSRGTYISENALLPGQVNNYFGGSEHDVFRAYRHEVAMINEFPGDFVAQRMAEIFQEQGLKTARQKYSYYAAGKNLTGENAYALLKGPRADATEAIVLVAAWRNTNDELNTSGVALVLTLARYFKRWSLWSKDIFFIITEDSTTGPQAWVDAYHSTHDPASVDDLQIKGGALQGALALDYNAPAGGHRYDKLHVLYDGINGQLPNLDLFNTIVLVAQGFLGISCSIQGMWRATDSYRTRLETIFRGMVSQGLGHATGPHSVFIPYHVDALTLQTVGDGWHDEISLGRTVESGFRSLNNLLEHLHQSFFFYLLMESKRFVSIGTYLPSAMLVAASFAITAIALWVQSGTPSLPTISSFTTSPAPQTEVITPPSSTDTFTIVSAASLQTTRRHFLQPLSFLLLAHLAGLIPLTLFLTLSGRHLPPLLLTFALLTLALPHLLPYTPLIPSDTRTLYLLQSLSLLLLSTALATLSTLNFPLGLLVGLLTSPLCFLRPAAALPTRLLLALVAPTSLLALLPFLWRERGWSAAAQAMLETAAQAALVHGVWSGVVLWCLWWPGWVVGATVAAARPATEEGKQADGGKGQKGGGKTAEAKR